MDRRYFWKKVWGAPDVPAHEALAFGNEGIRDSILAEARPGDIVVYLTSDATEADPLMRGRVTGAAELADPPKAVMFEELRVKRRRPEDYLPDGRFRWPFGIKVSRTWKVIDQEANDALIPDHASKGIRGGVTIHAMRPEEVRRFLRLRVEELVGGEVTDRQPFSISLSRPWRQKAGARAGAEVQPGSQLYVAVVADTHGTTFKVGSGKAQDRLDEFNRYRRGSQGETLWSLHYVHDFRTVEAARSAEDHLLARANELGHGSIDHSEFIVGIGMGQLAELFSEAVDIGAAQDADEEPDTA